MGWINPQSSLFRRNVIVVAVLLVISISLISQRQYFLSVPSIRSTLCDHATGYAANGLPKNLFVTAPGSQPTGARQGHLSDDLAPGDREWADEEMQVATSSEAVVPPAATAGPDSYVKMLKKDARMAIVTFLNEDLEHKDRDYYFLSTRMLTYQLLHAEQTRIKAEHREYIDWVVGVGQRVEEWKRRQLMKDGAVVVEIKDIPLEPGFTAGEPRWQHVMNKLRLFEWTEYERVLFIDADMVLQGPLDDLLYSRDSVHPRLTDYSQRKDHEPPLPSKYVMVARPDIAYMDGHNHKFPDDPAMTSDYLNAGFWLIAPDKMMFDFIIGIINLENRPFATNLPEQNLLNYIFRHCESWSEEGLRCGVGDPQGPMPWVNAGSIWSSNRVSMADKNGGVRALHYKGWDCWDGDPLRNLWNEWKDKMEATLGRGYVPPPPPPPPAPEPESQEKGGEEGQAGETHEEGKPDDDGDWMEKEPGQGAAEWKNVEDLSPDAKAALEEQKDKAHDSNAENKTETEKDRGGQASKAAGEDDGHTPQETSAHTDASGVR